MILTALPSALTSWQARRRFTRHALHSLASLALATGVLSMATATLSPRSAQAQAPARADAVGYPVKPIRIVVPWQAGGGTDILVRLVGDKLRERLGQQVMVENRPGGSTVIGAKALIAAPADGYTLMVSTNTTYSIVPHLFKAPPFDPDEAFEPIALLAETPMAIVVHPSLGVRDLTGFIEAARKRPGEITIASYGNGTSTHLVAELFQSTAGVKLNHVPFKGVEAVHAVTSGQVNAMIDGLFTALPQIRENRILGLAVMQSRRSEFAPAIPSVTELGLQGIDISIWYGVVAPRGTPAPIVERLSREFAAIMALPDVKDKLASMQVIPMVRGPAEARDFFRRQSDLYRTLVRNSKIALE